MRFESFVNLYNFPTEEFTSLFEFKTKAKDMKDGSIPKWRCNQQSIVSS
jgi:hypothetical protein